MREPYGEGVGPAGAHVGSGHSGRKPRLVVFGVDGGSWGLIDPLIEAGHLPAFRELVESGQRGPLESVEPPLTAPAWQSIFTGLSPAEHGVFDMTVYDSRLGRRRPPSYEDWRSEPFWARVEALGLTGGYLGVPFTYPPPDVDGWFVSGIMGTPTYGPAMFRPAALLGEVTAAAGEYPLDALEKRAGEYPIEILQRQIAWIHDAALYLARNHPVDVLVVVENYTDFVQHFFMRSREYAIGGEPVDVIRLAYEAADRLLADLRTEVGAEAPVAIVSDHGFAPLGGYINATHLAELLSRTGAERERAAESAFRALKGVWRATGKAALQALRIDPARVSQWGVRALHRAGDEADAVVIGHYGSLWLTGDPAATTDAEVERAARILGEVRDPETGGPLFEVLRGRALYSGPCVERAPHLLLRPTRPHHELRRAAPSAPLVIAQDAAGAVGMDRNTTEGTHDPAGIWAISASGAHVAQPRRLPDVQPALLALLEEGDEAASRPRAERAAETRSAYTPEEEQTILGRLQDLGYLD